MTDILDTPLTEIFCEYCEKTVKPSYQIRLAPDETGQPMDIIFWDCSKCERENILRDDLSILDAEVIG